MCFELYQSEIMKIDSLKRKLNFQESTTSSQLNRPIVNTYIVDTYDINIMQ